ncbi:MAG TPA: TonB family protein [Thiotrichaceae bacterium]|nr:TonB family protein [Thiotrichaceae bacterium]
MNTQSLYIEPDTERFIVALVIAALIHYAIIYGLGFAMPKSAQPLNTTMEVILVQKRTEQAPKKADYLAQVSYEGGGERLEDVRPSTPTIAPFPDQTAELVFTPPPPQIAAAPTEYQFQILTTDESSPDQVAAQTEVIPPDEPAEQGYDSQNLVFKDFVAENTLFINTRAMELASLQAELNEQFEEYAKRPRKKFINASTQEYKYANYMETWRKKIEQVGNANYPEMARHQKLSGNLILDVAINADGTLHQIELKDPSKNNIFNEATLQIVHHAAPFEPFPEEIRKDTDILHITRTWKFRYNGLSSQ